MITSIKNAEHYKWGENCDGWHLLNSGSLSIIEEKMPPGTAEQYHFHKKAQQVFYVLNGPATFEIEGEIITVQDRESIHIPPLTRHRIINQSLDEIRFVVISEPKAHGDRENVVLS
ncbi:cupin domain-containing protein [Pedobacter sp. L105]|uniref:cupin domain-containing protein n=1 Tax=Pedobacter sp. L105 TaxID=1641871 RepID=UPI00131ED12D|nr:cupin domain-containing protein [Pedobacter sp. L105]